MLFDIPAVTAILADRDGSRDRNDLRFLAEENNEQFPDPEYDPGDDFPPPTDEEPVQQALFSLFAYFSYRLDVYVFAFAFWALHVLSPVQLFLNEKT